MDDHEQGSARGDPKNPSAEAAEAGLVSKKQKTIPDAHLRTAHRHEPAWIRDHHNPEWVSTHPIQAIQYLEEIEECLDRSRDERQRLAASIQDNEARYRELDRNYRDLCRELEDLRVRLASLRKAASETEALGRKVMHLEAEVERLLEENQYLHTDKSLLLSRVASVNRDRTAVSAIGEHSRYDLTQEFKSFCDHVYQAARSLAAAYRSSTAVGPTYRRAQVRIQAANLASEISAKALLDGAGDLSQDILSQVQGLLKEGRHLARRLAASDPPVEIWFAQPGDRCDRTSLDKGLFEAYRGSEEHGSVAFTVFPGLRIGGRPLVPAMVWVTGEAETPRVLSIAAPELEEADDLEPADEGDIPVQT